MSVTLKTVRKVSKYLSMNRDSLHTVSSMVTKLNISYQRAKAVFDFLEEQGQIEKVPNSAEIEFFRITDSLKPQAGEQS